MSESVTNVDVDSYTSDSDSIFDRPTNRFNTSNLNLLEGKSGVTLQLTTTCTARSNPPPTFTNIPPLPHSTSITSRLPLPEALANIDRIQESFDNRQPTPPTPTNSGIASQPRSTTTPAPAPTHIPTIAQLSQDASISSGTDGLRATVRQRQLPGLPSFLHPPGSA